MDVASQITQTITDKAISEAGNQSSGGLAPVGQNPSEASPFEQILSNRIEETSSSRGKLNGQVLESFGLVPEKKIGAISAQGLEISPAEIRASQEIRTHGKVMDLLTEVNRGAHQMEDMITLATSGQKFTPAELLAMQAGLSQKVFQLEITSKVVETGASSTKQVLQQGAAG